jgi:HEAT repeat protein
MTNVLDFRPDRIILNRAEQLVNNPDLLLKDRERGVPCLLRALKLGDIDLRRKIIILLGSFAAEEIIWPLYDILKDESEPCELREQAAIHINVLGPFLENQRLLAKRLLRLLSDEEHDTRVLAIIALGWEGNHAAKQPLTECLYDVSDEIQEVAILSLCNIKDSRILDILITRMHSASFEQRRAILYSIWRFTDRAEEILSIYRNELEHGDMRLKLDVMILLGELDNMDKQADIYWKYIGDENPRIRTIALERLGKLGHITTEEAIRARVVASLA